MEPDFESAREKYRPKKVRFLLIAEAPPKASTGRFFYFEDVSRGDGLFLETVKTLYPADYTSARELRRRKGEFLKRFMNDGFYLIDASEEPMASTERTRKEAQLREHLSGLMEKVSCLASTDTRIILISVPVYHVCCAQLVAKGFPVINIGPIEFPASGHQRKFRRKLADLLRQHGWR